MLLNLALCAVAEEAPYDDDPAIIKILAELGENEAVVLPASKLGPKATEKAAKGRYQGGPGTRDYCNKMPYSTTRQTAIYAGGSHQTYRPNDVWEYHLGSNTWHMLFPHEGGNHAHIKGTLYGVLRPQLGGRKVSLTQKQQAEWNTTAKWWKENVIVKDGVISTKSGGPIMPAHTWDAFTYDDQVGRLYWASGAHPGGHPFYHAGLTGTPLEEVEAKMNPDNTSMWMFDPAAEKWRVYRNTGEQPEFRGMGATMQYLSDLKQSIYYVAASNVSPGAFEMWMFNAKTNQWKELKPNGGKSISELALKLGEAPMSEQQVAYSPTHKKLVAVLKNDTFVYDVSKNEWAKVNTDDRIYGHDAKSTFVYDSNADLFILANPRHETPLAAFSLATKQWHVIKPTGADIPHKPYGAYKGFYDPRLNVFALHVEGKGTNWVYRAKK